MGTFTYGPITIRVRVVEDLFERTYERGVPEDRPGAWDESGRRFFWQLSSELTRSGRKRIDEVHWLLAFMRLGEGIPARVFGELGVSPEDVERFARGDADSDESRPGPGRLYSPEEVAEYLGVHVQTVRTWIRSGKLPARRLAGQRALRVKEADLERVLEPVDVEVET
jgi:excisionase family DNA binding protein